MFVGTCRKVNVTASIQTRGPGSCDQKRDREHCPAGREELRRPRLAPSWRHSATRCGPCSPARPGSGPAPEATLRMLFGLQRTTKRSRTLSVSDTGKHLGTASTSLSGEQQTYRGAFREGASVSG